MMLIHLTTGDCVELTLAEEVRQENEWLTCVDADGRRIAAFAASAVAGFERQPVKDARGEAAALASTA